MTTVMAFHEVDDVDHWLRSTQGAADAMKFGGVRPETMVMPVES